MKLYAVDMDYGRVELKEVEVTRESKLYYFVERGTSITGYSTRVNKMAAANGLRGLALTPAEAWIRAEKRTERRLAEAEAAVEECRAEHARVLDCRPHA